MTGKGHFATGVVFSLFAFEYSTNLGGHGLTSALFCILGANAPDYLEIRKKVYRDVKNPKRCTGTKTIIPHRTITHWLPIWILMLLFAIVNINPEYLNIPFIHKLQIENNLNYSNYIFSLILGYAIGGLTHLLTDIPNPMGIPILTPYKRFSLNLWRSGKMEPLIISCFIIFTLYYIGIVDLNEQYIDKIKDYFVSL